MRVTGGSDFDVQYRAGSSYALRRLRPANVISPAAKPMSEEGSGTTFAMTQG